MDVVVTTGAVRRTKLQSNRSHQQTNTQLFYRPDGTLNSSIPYHLQTGCPSHLPTNTVRALKEKLNFCILFNLPIFPEEKGWNGTTLVPFQILARLDFSAFFGTSIPDKK